MTTVSLPEVTFNIVSAVTQVANNPQKILVIAQKTSVGTATSGELVSGIGNDNSQDTLSGINSMGAAIIRAIRALNDITQVDAIFLDDDGSAVPATGTIAVTGTATEAGTLTIIIGSEFNHTLSVAVADTDTASLIGDAIEAAIIADVRIPVTAVNVTGTVTLTAVNEGTYGNTLGIEVRGVVAGVSTTVTGMASGATDPTLTGVFDVVGDVRYQGVVWPYADDTSEVRTFLDARFNVDNNVLDGVAFTSKTDTFANLNTVYGALNSQSLVVIGDEITTATNVASPALIEIPVVKAAEFTAIRGLRLTDGASIAQFVIARTGALDSFGGSALASKPYFNTPFPQLVVIEQGRGFTQVEIDTLKDSGVSVIGNNRAANTVISGEIVTTYKTDVAANPDDTFKFLNFVDTSSNIREFYVNNFRARFAQSRLTDGDLVAGRDIANKQLIETTAIEFYTTLSGPDFVLTQRGEPARNFFIDNLLVTLDLVTGSVTVNMKAPLVTQLRKMIGTISITFSADS